MDIKLSKLLKEEIPDLCINKSRDIIFEELNMQMENLDCYTLDDKQFYCSLVNKFKNDLKDNVKNIHIWTELGVNYLKLLMENHADDKFIYSHNEWLASYRKCINLINRKLDLLSTLADKQTVALTKSHQDHSILENIKLKKKIISEIDKYLSTKSINEIAKPLSESSKDKILTEIGMRCAVKLDKEQFFQLLAQVSAIKVGKILVKQLKNCQPLYGYYKTGYLDLIE
ncbi:MAG: hypothetical protein MHPSP_001776, partial [Paramarteilia canceri]